MKCIPVHGDAPRRSKIAGQRKNTIDRCADGVEASLNTDFETQAAQAHAHKNFTARQGKLYGDTPEPGPDVIRDDGTVDGAPVEEFKRTIQAASCSVQAHAPKPPEFTP